MTDYKELYDFAAKVIREKSYEFPVPVMGVDAQVIRKMIEQLRAADELIKHAEWLIDSINLYLVGRDDLDKFSCDQVKADIKKWRDMERGENG